MLNEQEQKIIQAITDIYYMRPVLAKLYCKINEIGYANTLDFLHEIMLSARQEVDNLLEERKTSGEIKDVAQARKSIAGRIFSNCIL